MKLLNFSIITFFLIISPQAFSQNLSEHINLKWTNSKEIKYSEDKINKYLHFEDCGYNESQLPTFRFKKPISSGEEAIFSEITNYEYAPFTKTDIENVEGIDKITNAPSVLTTTGVEQKKHFVIVDITPIRYNQASGQYEKLISFDLTISIKQAGPKSRTSTYTTSSVLATGSWYKIGVTNDGIYKLTYTDLEKLGINPSSINPRNISIYNNGGGMLPELNSAFRFDDLIENAIYVSGEDDGIFNENDYILFYGQSPNRWSFNKANGVFGHSNHLYSNFTYYFITINSNAGKRIQTDNSPNSTSTHFVTSHDVILWRDIDSLNIMQSGRKWYDKIFDQQNHYNFAFSVPDIISTENTNIKIGVTARTTSTSSNFTVDINGYKKSSPVPAVDGDFDGSFAADSIFSRTIKTSSSSINVSLTYNKASDPSSIAWLDYINLTARRSLIFHGNQLQFMDSKSVGKGNIAEFSISNTTSNTKIWEVTDPTNVNNINLQTNRNSQSFKIASDTLRTFFAFDGTSFLTPFLEGSISNQNLHSLSNINMIIVSHPDFLSEANRLADFHRSNEGLSVYVTTPQTIYNEFSCGAQDISAIRDFLKMLYNKANSEKEMPRYLLLFGDGSYDYKNRIPSNTNLVPSYEALNSVSPTASFVSDDYYTLLDDKEGPNCTGLLDLSVGRFPVSTTEQAKDAVDKVIRYSSNVSSNSENACSTSTNISRLSDWRNSMCFIADDQDGNMHLDDAEDAASIITTNKHVYNVNKIYFDAYKQISNTGGQRYPDVTDAINRQMEKGALIVNYTGHGGVKNLSHERVVSISDINSWKNFNNLPIFVTATCEFSKWDNPAINSAGEYVFQNKNGGAIALFTTSRMVMAYPNSIINQAFTSNLFTPVNGKSPRLGDIFKAAKNISKSFPNDKNFCLLGDPALKLAIPELGVATNKINNSSVSEITDTLRALSKVTISGYITDTNGQKNTSFNGILYPSIYDKESTISTLANDADSKVTTFSQQKNVLYRGKAKITNGEFSFTFVIPKDISYKYGKGKISYYAENGTIDANGYFNNIIIGGTDTNSILDNKGPQVELFLNDEKFVSGGLTDENPILLVNVSDSSGINTAGNSIGHDIIATIDNNTEKTIILNDYYEAELDNYQKGTIRYALKDIPEGKHTLRLKIWDSYNNSSETTTEFIVAKSAEFAIKNVFNYPNPFTTNTGFYFTHNQPCCAFNIQISIFTVSGKLVKTINQLVEPNGYTIDPIYWDGKDDYGDKLAKGVYLYQLRVRTQDGKTTEKIEKIVIL